MKKLFAGLCLLVALGYCTNTLAADDKKMMKKETPADGSSITISGNMAIKGTDAAKDVVCRIYDGRGKTMRTFNLVATGDLAKDIMAKRENGDKVKVTGTVASNGESIQVKSIETLVNMKK